MSLWQRFLAYIGLGPEHNYTDSEQGHAGVSTLQAGPGTLQADRLRTGQPSTQRIGGMEYATAYAGSTATGPYTGASHSPGQVMGQQFQGQISGSGTTEFNSDTNAPNALATRPSPGMVAVQQTYQPNSQTGQDYFLSGSPNMQAVFESPTPEPKIVFPNDFESSKTIADHFKANNPVVINLENTSGKIARRIIDFSSGLCYALDGKIESVGSNIYLLTPQNPIYSQGELEMYIKQASNATLN